jgi:hypothetical protein
MRTAVALAEAGQPCSGAALHRSLRHIAACPSSRQLFRTRVKSAVPGLPYGQRDGGTSGVLKGNRRRSRMSVSVRHPAANSQQPVAGSQRPTFR